MEQLGQQRVLEPALSAVAFPLGSNGRNLLLPRRFHLEKRRTEEPKSLQKLSWEEEELDPLEPHRADSHLAKKMEVEPEAVPVSRWKELSLSMFLAAVQQQEERLPQHELPRRLSAPVHSTEQEHQLELS